MLLPRSTPPSPGLTDGRAVSLTERGSMFQNRRVLDGIFLHLEHGHRFGYRLLVL